MKISLIKRLCFVLFTLASGSLVSGNTANDNTREPIDYVNPYW